MDRRVGNQDLGLFTRGTEVYRMATDINCQTSRHCRAGFVCYELVARTHPYVEKTPGQLIPSPILNSIGPNYNHSSLTDAPVSDLSGSSTRLAFQPVEAWTGCICC